ncbi:MAG: 4Fe-4S dicluster domain-containing protein [Acidobacteria bacterium]|nr:4Fe-4S dicluster domain-containing protein [Acidobacteriota bacterium]
MKEPEDARKIKQVGYEKDMPALTSGHHIEDLPAEILEMYPDGISRRRFLSLLSASAALAMGASCSQIDRGTIVSYTKNPGEIKPGVAACYASTFQEGWTTQGVLVKTREGRPIHIEGNPDHPISKGTVSLRAMGDLLGLYDPDRLRAPKLNSDASTWEAAIAALTQAFEKARTGDKPFLLMTGAMVSPSQRSLIADLKQAVPGLWHVCWEPASPLSQFLDDPSIPKLHSEPAKIILSLQSDFLGSDGNAPSYIQGFASSRRISSPSDRMNRLWVFEGPMTLTGANADVRIRVRPSGIASLAYALIRLLNEVHGIALPYGMDANYLKPYMPAKTAETLGLELVNLELLARDLAEARQSVQVLAGPSLPAEASVASSLLKIMLEADGDQSGSHGSRLFVAEAVSNAELRNLIEEAAGGKFSGAIFWGVNPAYAFPEASLWKEAVGNIPDTFRIGPYEDETATDCDWRLPEHHWLEAWGDFLSTSRFVSLRQPTIGPLHSTRQGEDILLACMRDMDLQVPGSYREYIKTVWKSRIYPGNSPVRFDDYWNAALHNGGAESIREFSSFLQGSWQTAELRGVWSSLGSESKEDVPNAGNEAAADAIDGMELVLAPQAGVYDGRYANNGWLNELPDPVTRATWGNPLSLSIADAERLGVGNGDVVEVTNGETTIEAPVLIQPGQCPGVAALALGYGRRSGSVAAGIGVNAYPLLNNSPGSPLLAPGISMRRKNTRERRPLPLTQTHDRMEGRDLARSWTLNRYALESGKEKVHDPHHHASLIPERKYPEHKWSMAVDLSACVGCSACVIACQSENNIPVVGPEQVLKGRHMHWIRIDRYYEGDPHDPRVLHQPMFCQHCDDAPCEIVCPVNATTHSPDGLNQMAYNRCVGTRYCSNNCPFKVRRFNFFDYTSMKKEPENLVFNPEVTVRPRGVMEKCTLCIQRIQNAKQKAKVEDRSIKDGDIVPACAAACPAGAIVFGDLNDPDSRVAKLSKSNRAYHMLEELGIKPSVTYLADISHPAIIEELR